MKLVVKDINLSSGGPLIAVVNEADARELNIYALDRIHIKRVRSKKSLIAVVDISDKGVLKGEIGFFDEVLKRIDVTEGTAVEVMFAPRPASVRFISKKLDGHELRDSEISEIVKDVVENRFSEIELTYFVSACYTNGLSLKESAALTKAIVASGSQLRFHSQVVFDKHCAGGVPNNRTTMIVVPILAALGYTIPKTSSRAITSPSGTADTMEVLAPVTMSKSKVLKVVKKTRACLIWGGAVNLASADDILIRVRHPLRLDPEGMLLASIMAKKKAVNATHVLIDLPYGYGSKFSTKRQAITLGKKFMKLGKILGMYVKVVYTEGSQPIGNGIGPALEAIDVLSILNGDGPNDLREKAIYLATEMLKMVNVKNPQQKVLDILNSGKALESFRAIIVAQGGRKQFYIPKAKYIYDVKAKKSGIIKQINNKGIAKIARLAGAPKDKVAGLYLRVHRGKKIKKGEVLFTIHTSSPEKLKNTLKQLPLLQTILV